MRKEQVKIILNNILEKDNIEGIDIVGEWDYTFLIEDLNEKPKFICDDSILVIRERNHTYYFEIEKIYFIVSTCSCPFESDG